MSYSKVIVSILQNSFFSFKLNWVNFVKYVWFAPYFVCNSFCVICQHRPFSLRLSYCRSTCRFCSECEETPYKRIIEPSDWNRYFTISEYFRCDNKSWIEFQTIRKEFKIVRENKDPMNIWIILCLIAIAILQVSLLIHFNMNIYRLSQM